MADKSNALSKKTIIAIVAIIVLLFIAGLSVGIFLADKGRTEAVDGNQTVAEGNQTTDGNQATDGDQNADENQTDENQTADADKADGNNQEENNDNQTTTPDNNGTVVENNEATANNGVVNNNVENNDGTANNNATNNNTVANNNGVTTNADVNEVGETTVTRVEEQERLVSRDYWDWWTPTSVVAASASRVADKIVPTTPDFTVEKTASTGVMNADGEIVEGTETLVYAGQNITYTIRVTNNGSEDIENIEITDKIPQNTTFVSFDNVYNIVKGTEIKDKNDETVGVKWVVSVPGHEENEEAKSVIVKFTVKVNEMMPLKDENGNIVVDGTGKVVEVPTTGTIANTAIANGKESNEGEPTKTAIITNNKSSVITRNGEVVETAKIGDRIKYTITVTNTGDAEGSTCITDTVPTGTKLISVDGKEISADEKLTSVNWTVQLGAKGTETATVSKEFVVEIESINGEIKNIGDVGGTPTNEDKNETGNLDVVKTASNITRNGENVEKDENGNVKVKVGDVIEYTITIANTGSLDIEDIVVDEQLKGLTIESLTINGELQTTFEKNTEGKLVVGYLRAAKEAVENEDGELVTPAISAGKAVITATYTVVQVPDVTGNPDKTIYNKVVASGTTVPTDPKIDPEPIEGEGDETVIVEDAPSLEVDKAATALKSNGSTEFVEIDDLTNVMVRPGDVIEYTITITNTGNITLENIKLTDSLKVTVDGVEKDLERQEDGSMASIIAIIESLSAEAGKNVETIKTYYTVVEADTVDSNPIHNEVKATVPDGPSGSDGEDVPVNPDTSVSGSKTWKDNNNAYTTRPASITVNLLQNGTEIKDTTISADTEGNWTYEFTGLPTYDADGKLYTYTVTEDAVDGYTTVVSGYNITNKLTGTTSVSGSKTWKDNNNAYTTRPESITVNLLQNGTEIKDTTISADAEGNWAYSFIDLAKYDADGKLYTYTVTEDAVYGYTTTSINKDETTGEFIITNTLTGTTSVSGSKTWVDSENVYGTRPESITVNLLQNGTEIKDTTISADTEGNWTYSFTDLAKYDADGKLYTYTVTEDTVEGYTTLPIVKDTSTGKYNITNTLTLGITKSATDAAGNEITELTYDSNTPSSNNFNYVLTVTSQEKLEIPQTVTDILPTGITVAEEWERPSNVTVTTDAETGKQTITWTVDLSESTTTTLTIPVVADESLFSGKETEEETVISVLDLKFENKGTTYTGSKNSNSKGLNIFLRALDAANPNSDNGYIYAGNVETSDLVDRSTKFVTGYNDELVNQTLSSNDSNAIKAMLVDIAEDNADTENGLGRYLKNGLPSLTDINTTLTNLYGGNIKISPTQVILWYKVPYSVDETLDRHYTISDENENQLFDGTISLPECAYHIDGIIVDISTLGGYIPKGTTVPVKNRATIGKIYDDATVDITYKPSELTNISVKKEWVDNSAEKPTSVTAQLFADGVEEGEPVVLNAGNSWSYDWTTLYKNKGEEEIEYTVKEIKVGTEDVVGNETSKYISTQEFDEETRTVTIINTRKAEIVSTKTASTENGTITIVQGQQNVTKEIPVEIGDTIEYTITVENKGALTEKDVTVQDTNPQHTTPISGSALEVTFNNGTTERKLTATEVQEFINGTFKVDVPAYTIFTFKFSVKVTDGSLTDKITNTAYVGGNPVGPTINSIERTVNVTKYKNNIASTNIILVLDVSSSMNNSRIVDARNAINTFVENTYAIEKNKNVTFTLLTFANRDYTEGKGATKGKPAYSANQKGGIFEFNDDGDYIVTYDNKDKFTNAVSGIVTDSGTNIRAGLEVTEKAIYGEDGNGGIAGMEEYKDYEQIVIFFGDGEPYGETEQLNNETGIKAKADDIRKKGAKIFSIGFGSDVSKPNSTGYKVLSKISDDGKVYTSSNYTDLVRDFSKIVGTDPSYDQITVNGNAIINITSNAQDIIVDADNPIIITVGGVSTIITSKADATANHITYTNKQITWDVSSYSESEALTITYYVQ